MNTLARRVFGVSVALATAVAASASDAAFSRDDIAGREGPPEAAWSCRSAPSRTVDRQFTVSARIRPLLFWTPRREVGEARFMSSESAGGGRHLELLIGTDPDRTPRGINRWGYIAETVCGTRAELVGLMTESTEQTVDQAQAALDEARGRPLKAIRARQVSGEAATEIVTVRPTADVTYRDLGRVLALLPPHGEASVATVPPGTDSGFLVAVTGLIHESVSAHRESRRARGGLRRAYVYAGRLYDITMRSSTVVDTMSAIESDFEVRNRATGSTSEFRIVYATADGEPIRIVHRPRWWLEVELLAANRPRARP